MIPAVFLVALLVVSLAPAAPAPAPSASPALAALEVEILSPLGKPIPRGKAVLFSIQTGEDLPPCAGYQELPAVEFSEGKLAQDLPSGLYRLEIVADGWQGAVEEELALSPGEKKKVPLRLEPGFVIAGQVTDEGGLPLAGASVSVSFRGKGRTWFMSDAEQATTDGDGRFRLSSLAEGLHRVKASMEGRVGVSLDDVATGAEDLALVLKKGWTIKGRLAGFPPGLSQELEVDLKRDRSYDYKRMTCDGEGNFALNDLENGTYDIRIHGDEWVSDWSRQVKAEEESRARPIAIEVFKAAKISGRVIDSRTGEIIRNAYLKLGQDDLTWPSIASRRDDTGEYTFFSLLPGAYDLRVSMDFSFDKPLASREVAVKAGEELKGVDFRIDPGRKASISGTTMDERGEPVAGAKVRLYSREAGAKGGRMQMAGEAAEADAAGDFLVADYISRATEFVLSAEKDGFAPARSDPLVLSPDSPSAAGAVLVFDAGLSFEVEVSDAEGMPVYQARVELEKDSVRDGNRSDWASPFFREKKLADAHGRCLFDHLAPLPYSLTVNRKGFVEHTEKVTFAPGETGKKVAVALQAGRAVTVTVADAAGEPIAGARVSAAAEDDRKSVLYLSQRSGHETDAAGVCRIENLPAGPLRVSVSAEGYVALTRIRVAPDEESAAVVLAAGGAIAGRALTAEGNPPKWVHASAQKKREDPFDFGFQGGEKRDLGEGRFRIEGLEPGPYDLVVDADGWGRKTIGGLVVQAGETAEAGEFRLEPEALLSGTVLDPALQPLGKAMASLKGPLSSRFFAAADDDTGRFELGRLPAGNYTLTVSAPNCRREEIAGISLSAGEKKEFPPVVLRDLTPEEKEQEKARNRFLPSLGIAWADSSFNKSGGFPVGEVKSGSAAEKAGIRPGDTIVQVDGKDFAEDPGAFWRGIFARPGTKVKLTVRRKEGGATDEVEIVMPPWDYDEMIRKMEF
jgi:protocatechuate 3,4-dioxygenase beta subunit